ncbi:MAG TPA: hypothetical protein VGN17_00290 [Bryobacteraceae bacterium]|jgi:hypothetical protein
MIDTAIKLIEEYFKYKKHHDEKKEEELMLSVADELRQRSQRNGGNLLKAEPGSEVDRFLGRMVAKGYLVRVQFGYMLPEFAPVHRSGGLY